MNQTLRRIWHLWGRARHDAEIREEIEIHRALRQEALQRNGLSAREAAIESQRTLGSVALAIDDTRDVWAFRAAENLWRDVRVALRGLAKSPGFSLTVILTLALGIGANAAIFGLFDALSLRALPVARPQELVLLQTADDSGPGSAANSSFSYPVVRALAEHTEIFAGVGGFSSFDFIVDVGGIPRTVPGALVTGGFYQTLGLAPEAGRLLTPEDDEPGRAVAVVISHDYWRREYGQDPAVVGRTLRLNNVAATIVGVSPPRFVGANVGSIADVTLPVAALPAISPQASMLLQPGNFWLRILARPVPGLSRTALASQLPAVWARTWETVVPAQWPAARREIFERSRFLVVPGATGWTTLRATFQQPLMVLFVGVGLVLSIACANVAGLMLARASNRQGEIAARLALGAGRGRIIQQLLTESALLSFIAALVSIAVAVGAGRVLLATVSTTRFRVALDLAPNWRLIGFTSAIAIVASLLFGLAPALRSSSVSPLAALKQGGRTTTGSSRMLRLLLVAQVGISLVVVTGAGLFARTVQNLGSFNPGFTASGVLLVDLQARRTALPEEVLKTLRQLPGVKAASVSTHTPLSGAVWSDIAVPRGQPLPERDTAFFVGADPDFFEVLRIGLTSGRAFTADDNVTTPPVAIVNETFASRYSPRQLPIGEYLSARVRGQQRELQVVGVAKDTNARGLRQQAPATVYVPYRQLTGNLPSTVEVRVAGPLASAAADIKHSLQPHMPDTPIEVTTLVAQVDDTLVQERVMATLVTAFGVLALGLVVVGVYGLLSYTVTYRAREFGIRLALGASRRRIVSTVLQSTGWMVALGLCVGLPATWGASRLVSSMLFGLGPNDPATIVGATVLLGATALVAALVPALRAARIDPMMTMRSE